MRRKIFGKENPSMSCMFLLFFCFLSLVMFLSFLFLLLIIIINISIIIIITTSYYSDYSFIYILLLTVRLPLQVWLDGMASRPNSQPLTTKGVKNVSLYFLWVIRRPIGNRARKCKRFFSSIFLPTK